MQFSFQPLAEYKLSNGLERRQLFCSSSSVFSRILSEPPTKGNKSRSLEERKRQPISFARRSARPYLSNMAEKDREIDCPTTWTPDEWLLKQNSRGPYSLLLILWLPHVVYLLRHLYNLGTSPLFHLGGENLTSGLCPEDGGFGCKRRQRNDRGKGLLRITSKSKHLVVQRYL